MTFAEQHQRIAESADAEASLPALAAAVPDDADPAASASAVFPTSAPGVSTDHAAPMVLDLQAVADVDGLTQEVTVLRASIRLLANGRDMAVHVKVLAELRHQIEALCRVLKTQRSLEGSGGDAEVIRALEELGDDLGVER